MTWGKNLVYSFNNNGPMDVGLFRITTRPSDRNQYFAGGTLDTRDVIAIAPESVQGVRTTVSRGGRTSGWDCGLITYRNVTVNVAEPGGANEFLIPNAFSIWMLSAKRDSGQVSSPLVVMRTRLPPVSCSAGLRPVLGRVTRGTAPSRTLIRSSASRYARLVLVDLQLRALRTGVALAIVAAYVVACGPPTPVTTMPLKSIPNPPQVCAGVGLDGVIRGSPTDPLIAWIEGGGQRLEAIWPAGYQAAFTPRLEVLDAGGRVVLRDGDRVAGGCDIGDGIYLAPPFTD